MSARVWLAALVTAALILAAMTYGRSRPEQVLLSRHSEPAIHMPDRQVAVTAAGKLYHDPSCPYIHGKAEMMSAREAARLGYTPCPRCLGRYLRR